MWLAAHKKSWELTYVVESVVKAIFYHGINNVTAEMSRLTDK